MPRLTERLLNQNIDQDTCLARARTIARQLVLGEIPEPIPERDPLYFLNVVRLTIGELTEKRYLLLRKKELSSYVSREAERCLVNECSDRSLFQDLLSECRRTIPVPEPEPDRGLDRGFKAVDTYESWLQSWFSRPHAASYKKKCLEIPQKDRNALQERVLDTLSQFRHHPGTRRVWFQLLLFHERYEDGLASLLADEPDPLKCSADEKALIAASVADETAIPFLHQWTERLIEKRTAAHYKEAGNCLSLLEQAYRNHGRKSRFHEWLEILHRRYARFTAFRKELTAFENRN
ncbi:hypothetical protein [Alteribacter natronophilus]|uniref:hypothetical protein n=1 Tax=Alteribacter natronophilus TaxID=2583810 RepID=UPI00110DC7D7|nr:hypothetical protein [Alteribacter natronophilus]TMW71496.1 hypothetical protein FGB90_10670 [Alteribacter natronophilus]